jgi:hypothetical protein
MLMASLGYADEEAAKERSDRDLSPTPSTDTVTNMAPFMPFQVILVII